MKGKIKIFNNIIKNGKLYSYGGEKDLFVQSPKYRRRGLSKDGIRPSYKGQSSEYIEVKDVNPLKFDGLFLEITKYTWT